MSTQFFEAGLWGVLCEYTHLISAWCRQGHSIEARVLVMASPNAWSLGITCCLRQLGAPPRGMFLFTRSLITSGLSWASLQGSWLPIRRKWKVQMPLKGLGWECTKHPLVTFSWSYQVTGPTKDSRGRKTDSTTWQWSAVYAQGGKKSLAPLFADYLASDCPRLRDTHLITVSTSKTSISWSIADVGCVPWLWALFIWKPGVQWEKRAWSGSEGKASLQYLYMHIAFHLILFLNTLLPPSNVPGSDSTFFNPPFLTFSIEESSNILLWWGGYSHPTIHS